MSRSQRTRGIRATLLVVVVLLAATAAHAQGSSPCSPTTNRCGGDTVITTSHLQIGGQSSLSSEGLHDPGRLSDGTVAEALYEFTFDRSTGLLTLRATNTSQIGAMLTGIFLNATPAVTGMSLVSHTGHVSWILAFDQDRTDGFVNTHPHLPYLRGDGFGIFSVFLSNRGSDTGKNSGDPDSEISPRGHEVTFVIQVYGDLSQITACSFTSVGSRIPPGDRIVIALGRFQGGVQGGSGFIGPCEGGPLLVSLADFHAFPADASVTVTWETASEIDNAGFAVLREDVRAQRVERLNSTLIPGQGTSVSGGSYAFIDTTAVNGRRYLYSLEDWDIYDFNTIHAPKTAVPNPARPPIRLIAPAYEEKAGSAVRFRWEADGRMVHIVEISGDATFPAGGTLRIHAGARTARGLTSAEVARMAEMAASGEGGVYWRVQGRDARGRVSRSQTFFLAVD